MAGKNKQKSDARRYKRNHTAYEKDTLTGKLRMLFRTKRGKIDRK